MTVGNLVDPAATQSERTELIRYDSPVWHGFIFASQVGEAGDFWGSQVRYAGEHAGFRLAGVVGYERVTDVATPAVFRLPARPAYSTRRSSGASRTSRPWVSPSRPCMCRPACSSRVTTTRPTTADRSLGAASGYWGETTAHKKDTSHWFIQAGISKNWFGPGITSTWGEYGVATDFGADITCGIRSAARAASACVGTAGRNFNATAGNGFTPVNGVTDTETRIWGLGIAQRFDAAATDLYVGYRHFDVDITCTGAGANCSGRCRRAGAAKKLPTEGLDILIMGARVLF